MTEFLARADREVGEVAAQVEEAAAKFVETMVAYRFMPKKGKVEEAKPAEFFEPWYLFAEDYKGTWKKEQVGNLKLKSAFFQPLLFPAARGG